MSVKIVIFDLMQEDQEESQRILLQRIKKLKSHQFSNCAYAVVSDMESGELCDHLSDGLDLEHYIFVGALTAKLGAKHHREPTNGSRKISKKLIIYGEQQVTINIVTYFMHGDFDRRELREEITSFDHLKLSGSSYLVDSELSSEDLYDLLYPYILDEKDNLFVAEVVDAEWSSSDPEDEEWLELSFDP
ncbi:MAG: hypothetical protein QNL04_12520 [SAR324 cluster bacterium]|nr:hypothetical protein [SAR324 cluster bacterium]